MQLIGGPVVTACYELTLCRSYKSKAPCRLLFSDPHAFPLLLHSLSTASLHSLSSPPPLRLLHIHTMPATRTSLVPRCRVAKPYNTPGVRLAEWVRASPQTPSPRYPVLHVPSSLKEPEDQLRYIAEHRSIPYEQIAAACCPSGIGVSFVFTLYLHLC